MVAENAHKCQERVYGANAFHSHQCGNTAKVERDGRWYCGTHDPVRLREKQAERNAKWEKKWHAQRAADEAKEAARKELALNAARYIWLRDVGDATWEPLSKRTGYSAERADAEIDAAIARSKETP